MKIDKLAELVILGNHTDLGKAFAPLSESERAELAPILSKIRKQIIEEETKKFYLSEEKKAKIIDEYVYEKLKPYLDVIKKEVQKQLIELKKKYGKDYIWYGDDIRRLYDSILADANLSVLALYSFSDIKSEMKSNFRYFDDERLETVKRIFMDRKPAWLHDWSNFYLDETPFSSKQIFPVIEKWIKAGLMKKPTALNYYEVIAKKMLYSKFNKNNEQDSTLINRLRSNPALFDNIWPLFRLRNSVIGGVWDARSESYDETWPDAIIKLSQEGYIDRRKLLDAIVEGMSFADNGSNDGFQKLYKGFQKLYKRLETTKEERLAHQSKYISLLKCKSHQTIRFALDMLSMLEKDKLLDTNLFLAEVKTVLGSPKQEMVQFENTPDDYLTWFYALVKLSQDGYIDRNKFIDIALNGISSCFEAQDRAPRDGAPDYLLYEELYRKLKPTKEKRSTHQHKYLLLLKAEQSKVVKYALEMLHSLQKERLLDVKAFLVAINNILETKVKFLEVKYIAVFTLKIIANIVERETSLFNLAICIPVRILQHQNSDVQNIAFQLLEKYKENLNNNIKDEIIRMADIVKPSVRNKLLKLIDSQPNSDLRDASKTTDTSVNEDEAYLLLSKLPPSEQKTLGLYEIQSKKDFTYPSISSNILHHAILPTLDPITPITKIDTLNETIAHAIEVVDSADEIERIIDGLSRLCVRKPDDFSTKVEAVYNRCLKLSSESHWQTSQYRESLICGDEYSEVGYAFQDLLFTWFTGDFYSTLEWPECEMNYMLLTGGLKTTVARIKDVTKRIAENRAQPLLATPTHSGGWIDPIVWIERLIMYQRQQYEISRPDLNLSLLRLTPDNRSQALMKVDELHKDMRRIVVFALGGDEKPTYRDQKNYDTWISAARCRDPYADWSTTFRPLKVVDKWYGSIIPAQYKGTSYLKEYMKHLEKKKSEYKKPSKKMTHTLFSKIKNEVVAAWYDIPSAGLNLHFLQFHSFYTTWISSWCTQQWPLCPDGAYMTGVFHASSFHHSPLNPYTQYGVYSGLLQKNRPWHEVGHLLVCSGLVEENIDTRRIAIDVLINGIENGCFDPKMFADACINLYGARSFMESWNRSPIPHRLGASLLNVSQVSLLHAWAISEALQHWLPFTDLTQRHVHKVLEALLESQATIKQPLRSETIDILKTLKGNNKAAKVTKHILALNDHDSSIVEQVKKLAVVYRLQ